MGTSKTEPMRSPYSVLGTMVPVQGAFYVYVVIKDPSDGEFGSNKSLRLMWMKLHHAFVSLARWITYYSAIGDKDFILQCNSNGALAK